LLLATLAAAFLSGRIYGRLALLMHVRVYVCVRACVFVCVCVAGGKGEGEGEWVSMFIVGGRKRGRRGRE
jgi:hypothetical protein